MKLLTTSALALTLIAGAASAATFSGQVNVTGNTDSGLIIETDPNPASFSFDLDFVNDFETLTGLFTIFTNETDIGSDDLIDQAISAVFTLTSPVGGGTLDGTTDGFRIGFFGAIQGGTVVWDNPAMVSFGNGGVLSVSLSEEIFSKGFLFGTRPGEAYGASVDATFTLKTAEVPLPASALLLLGGLGGLAALRRRRKAA